MAATIYDVAALAGVSPATVSRVLNGTAVSPEKAQKVREAAQALDFRPNRTARMLRRGGSEIIALVIPDVENLFFTALARGVEDRALAAGYSVVLCNTDEQPEKEARYLDIAVAEQMAGVVLASASATPDLGALTARGMAVVAVDRPLPGLGVDVVTLDDAEAAARATEALYDRGHRRVACVTGSAGARTAALRAQGWREVVAERSPCTDPDLYLRFTDYRAARGRCAAAELLALPEPPDAIFAANNMLGVGVLAHLATVGLTPAAVGLAVLGDLPWPEWEAREVAVQPWPGRLLGETAADVLLARIRGDATPPRTLVLRSDRPEGPAAVTA
jgi:LacI family transcriptional regulator